MKKYSLLALFLGFGVTVFGYTVVLNNGKQVQGTLMSEDQNRIVIQDSTGIKLTFEKSTVNLEKTQAMNANEPKPSSDEHPPTAENTPSKPAGTKGLAEVAEENRNKPHKKARVLTQDDIASLPEISRIGTDSGEELPGTSATTTNNPAADTPGGASKRSALLDRLSQEQDKLAQEQEQCRDQGNQDPQGLDMVTKKGDPCPPGLITQFPCHAIPATAPGACAQAEATQRNIDSIQQQLDHLAANPE